jgi:hypothetical protein
MRSGWRGLASLAPSFARRGAFAVLLALAAAPLAAHALPPDEEPIEEVEPVEPYAPVHVPDDHDPLRAAHPLRIVAYALHPVGVALDYLIVRPAVWTARREPFRTIFGYDER